MGGSGRKIWSLAQIKQVFSGACQTQATDFPAALNQAEFPKAGHIVKDVTLSGQFRLDV